MRKKRLKIIGIIPARYKSTRFPGKVVAKILNKPMIQYVYQSAKRAKLLDEVIVATDDKRVAEVVHSFGGKVVMTSSSPKTGTERVAEVAKSITANIIVNIQGDEPLIEPAVIDRVVKPLLNRRNIITTPCVEIKDKDEFLDPNVVKVVKDKEGFALYFSRAPIPYPHAGLSTVCKSYALPYNSYKHIGIYAFHKNFLQKITKLSPLPLEEVESLEQLRVLEYGYKILTVEVDYNPISVDTPEDLMRVERLIKRRKSKK